MGKRAIIGVTMCVLSGVLVSASLVLPTWQVYEDQVTTVRSGLFYNCTLHDGHKDCASLTETGKILCEKYCWCVLGCWVDVVVN